MQNYYTRDKDNKQKIIKVIVAVIIAIIICIIIKIISTPKQRIIEVKTISWTYTIQIQELKAVHQDGWSYPPSGAYNITSRRKKRRTETYTDSNGKQKTRDIYDTWYEYTINKWMDSRVVTTHDLDKNPYWGETNLHTSGNSQLGDERENGRKQLYEVSGIDVLDKNNKNLYTFPISESLWTNLKINDQLDCQFVLGKPKTIQMAR